jgi:hypothetical protein
MFPNLKHCCLALVLCVSALTTVVAQQPSLSPEDIKNLVPVGLVKNIYGISHSGEFAVVALRSGIGGFDGVLVRFPSLETVLELPNSTRAYFIEEDRFLWQSSIQTQSTRVYQLPDVVEIGRFPLNIQKLTPRRYGDGFLYLQGSNIVHQPSDFTQPARVIGAVPRDFNPVFNTFVEVPDGQHVIAAGDTRTFMYNIETGERQDVLPYPVIREVVLTDDGRRALVQSSSLYVHDFATNRPIFERYGVSGIIRRDGRYVASLQIATYVPNAGILRVHDLDTGEEIFMARDVLEGSLDFIDDRLLYMTKTSDRWQGKINIFVPETRELIQTDILSYGVQGHQSGERFVALWANYDSYTETDVIDIETGELLRTFAGTIIRPLHDPTQIIFGDLIYGLPNGSVPPLPTVTGNTRGRYVNVRTSPSSSSRAMRSVSGDVTAVARSQDSRWLFIAEVQGWVSADVIALSGDVNSLIVSK